MAQELFRSKETEERLEKEQLVKRGYSLWLQYAEEYRILPYKYFYLLAEKKAAKLKLNKIPATYCKPDDYPEIPLFRIFEPQEVLAKLKDLSLDDLNKMIGEIEFAITTNYLYKSMKDWIAEANYQLIH